MKIMKLLQDRIIASMPHKLILILLVDYNDVTVEAALGNRFGCGALHVPCRCKP
jgi:hypothetical protein